MNNIHIADKLKVQTYLFGPPTNVFFLTLSMKLSILIFLYVLKYKVCTTYIVDKLKIQTYPFVRTTNVFFSIRQ